MNKRLSVEQAAKILGYHPNHVRRLLRQGAIQGWKQRNYRWLIEMREVQRIKERQTERGRFYPDDW